jgi:hypothetical protein
VLLTRSPLEHPQKGLSARLACVKHAASVRPEPGSNSPTKTIREKPQQTLLLPNKTIGTGISNTLLSSQKTTTHQNHPTTGQPRGTRSSIPGRLRKQDPMDPTGIARMFSRADSHHHMRQSSGWPCRPADDRRSDPSARLLPAVLLYPAGFRRANRVPQPTSPGTASGITPDTPRSFRLCFIGTRTSGPCQSDSHGLSRGDRIRRTA